jgi:hypothetical protein
MAKARRGARLIPLEFTNKTGDVSVYASARVADALKEITHDATLYEGVRLMQVLEAVYNQGKKDGARTVFDELDRAKRQIPHKNPGRPRKG